MKIHVMFRKLCLVATAFVTVHSFSFADTIVSYTDSSSSTNRGYYYLGGQYSNAVATSWTQTRSFSNVSIDALVFSNDPGFLSGTAYLMSAIGPGTTSASEIASVSFSAPLKIGNDPIPLTVLFSGLTLTRGTYYLVLSAPFRDFPFGSPLGWQVPEDAVAMVSSYARLGSAFEANNTISPPALYPPASNFVFASNPIYNVTGTLVATPEPSTMLLLGTGLLGPVGIARRKLLG